MRMPGLLLVPVAMLLVVSAGQARPSAPSAPSTAAEDVRLLGSSIESIHPAPFRSVSRTRFRAEVDALARRASTIPRDELLVGVLRIIALLVPGTATRACSRATPDNVPPFHLYPIRLYRFADGVFVVDAQDESLVRDRLVAVAGVPVARVFQLVNPLTPHDNAWNTRGMAPHFALTAEVLSGLGITDGAGPATFTFQRPGGERVDVALTPIPAPEYASEFADPLHGHYPSVLPSASKPLYLANSARAL